MKHTINLLLTSFVFWCYLFVVTQWQTIQFDVKSVFGFIMASATTLVVVSLFEMVKPIADNVVNKFKRKEK